MRTAKAMRKAVPAFGVAITIAALCVVLMEVAAFAGLRWVERMRLTIPAVLRTAAVYRDQPWAATYFRELETVVRRGREYQPYLAWRSRPFSGDTIMIGPDTLRRTVQSRCGADDYTIAMFGGSALWGYGVPDWATIPSWLAGAYARARPACVQNFGELDWNSSQEVLALMLELKRRPRPPDVVVFYDGCNEPASLDGQIDVHAGYAKTRAWFAEWPPRPPALFDVLAATNTAELFRQAQARLARGEGAVPPEDARASAQRAVKNYLRNLDLVEALGAHYGFTPAFFWQPLAFAGAKRLTSEEQGLVRSPGMEVERTAELMRAMHELIGGTRRPRLHDLSGTFDGVDDTVYITPCHLTPHGNRTIAAQIYRILSRATERP